MPSTITTTGENKIPGADDAQEKMQSTYEEESAGTVQFNENEQFNENAKFKRRIDKSKIPTCKILGVDIAAIDMNWLLKFTEKYLDKLKGDYMCVVNVYCGKWAYKMGLRSICFAHNG